MSVAFPAPAHLLSLDEWTQLDSDAAPHAELVEGVVLVVPRPAARHRRVAAKVAAALDEQLAPEWCAVVGVEVVLTPGAAAIVRAPDVVVIPTALADSGAPISAADVALAVEVVSPGTRGTDRVTKPAEYAAAGIPAYWRVESDAPAHIAVAGTRVSITLAEPLTR